MSELMMSHIELPSSPVSPSAASSAYSDCAKPTPMMASRMKKIALSRLFVSRISRLSVQEGAGGHTIVGSAVEVCVHLHREPRIRLHLHQNHSSRPLHDLFTTFKPLFTTSKRVSHSQHSKHHHL